MLFEKMQLEDDEKVLAVIRKHWWIILVEISVVMLLAFLPLLLLSLFSQSGLLGKNEAFVSISQWFTLHTAEISYFYIAWLLALWMTLGNFWTDYYLDLWAVTNKRVILIDQRGFFRRFMSSFRLERLQDMNIEINGFIATLLDFGTIEAQTAGGSNEKFLGEYMPRPRAIKAQIVGAADELTTQQSSRIENLKAQGL